MMRKYLIASVVCCYVGVLAGCDYSKSVQKKLSQSLGDEFNGYQVLSYPTDNFGLITSYNGKPTDANFLCDTWDCIGTKLPNDPPTQLAINGFAAVGNGGAAINLTESEQSKVVTKALLPSIAKLINVGGSLEGSNVRQTRLTIGRAYPRKLRRQQMQNYIQGLPKSSLLRQAFDAGKLTLVVADVVVDHVSLGIDVNDSTALALEAKFDPAAGRLKSFKGGDFDVNMSSARRGQYTFEISQPVVAMRLLKSQPAAGGFSAATDDDWGDWRTIKDLPPPGHRTAGR